MELGGLFYLDGQGPWADKEEILRFLAHKAFITYCDYPAICDMLDAIRDEHLRMGLPNPLTDKPLVKIAMEDISEMRRETPAWWRASEAAAKAEARQIGHVAAKKEESGHELDHSRAGRQLYPRSISQTSRSPLLRQKRLRMKGTARRRYANSGRLHPRR